jgi:hypothetical protein
LYFCDAAGTIRRVPKAIFLAPTVLLLCACSASRTVPPTAPNHGFTPAQLVKTDIDRVAEAQQREIFANLKLLTEKLYRRNPREFRKARQPDHVSAVARIFDYNHGWRFAELNGARDVQAIHLAFREDYQGDRVLAFISGLASMVQTSFNDKTELYVTDSLDPQRLYNAARNVEIAVWMLSTKRSPQGQLYLLSNEGAGPIANLSYEREFGKIIGGLDVLSKVISDKDNRNVVKVVQTLATAVFLPIK